MMKIPTILGLVLVVLIVGSIIVVSEFMLRGSSVASESIKPQSVELTNLSDVSFSVSWTTQAPATGVVEVSSSLAKRVVAYDQRDSAGKLGKYTTHAVDVRNLNPDSDYIIRILSNGKAFTDEKISRVHTAPSLSGASLTNLEPAYGTIYSIDGLPADGALVYVTVEGGQMLSTITKPSGSWLLPLSLVRTADLSSYLPVTDRMTEHIIIRSSTEETTAVTDTLNDSPVPEMTLGKTYDFRKLQAKTGSANALGMRPSPQTSPSGGTVLGSTSPRSFTVTLATPAQGAALTTTLPLVSGTGIPNALVSITLGITNPISGTTKVTEDGTWRFTPPKRLAPGKQSVTMTTTGANNKPIAITHLFEILKSGTQVLGDATPSATLEPTATVTATPIEVPTSTLAGEPVPTSGYTLPTILLILLSAGFLIAGAALVIPTRP